MAGKPKAGGKPPAADAAKALTDAGKDTIRDTLTGARACIDAGRFDAPEPSSPAKDALPPDCIYIDAAVTMIVDRFRQPEGPAVKSLLDAIRTEAIRTWRKEPFERVQLAAADWTDAAIFLDRFRRDRRGGLLFQNATYHLHRFLLSLDDFRHWLEQQSGGVRPGSARTAAPSGNQKPSAGARGTDKWMPTCDVLSWIRFREVRSGLEPGPDFHIARAELLAEFRSERLLAIGLRETGDNEPNPSAVHEDVPPRAFLLDEITITEWGRIGPNLSRPWENRGRRLPSFSDVRFDREAVMALWPLVRPDVDQRMAKVTAWMAENTTLGALAKRRIKRDDAIRDCMKATGCTSREALAGWNALPSERRGRRGAHK